METYLLPNPRLSRKAYIRGREKAKSNAHKRVIYRRGRKISKHLFAAGEKGDRMRAVTCAERHRERIAKLDIAGLKLVVDGEEVG